MDIQKLIELEFKLRWILGSIGLVALAVIMLRIYSGMLRSKESD